MTLGTNSGANRMRALFVPIVFLAFFTFSKVVYSASQIGIESLRGLEGLSVVIGSISPVLQGEITKEQIQTDVELKLRMAGIKIVPEQESVGIPGKPNLYVTITAKSLSLESLGIFPISISLQLYQGVYLQRNPNILVGVPTWERITVGAVGKKRVGMLRDEVRDLVDIFINDFLSVNPKKGK
jgi:hypothetical protein